MNTINKFILPALALAVLGACSSTKTYINYYDFGRTISAAEHGELSTPEVTDGQNGREIWIGYGRIRYQADSGMTVESLYPSFGYRERLTNWSDAGLALAWTQNNHYLASDLKIMPLKGNINFGLTLFGQYYQSQDKGDGAAAGIALPLGVPLAYDRLSLYIAPRFSRSQNLVMMVETVTTSGLTSDKDQDKTYAYSNVWGLSAGLIWSLPLGGHRLKIRPEVSYSAGREVHYYHVVYEMLTASLKLHLVF